MCLSVVSYGNRFFSLHLDPKTTERKEGLLGWKDRRISNIALSCSFITKKINKIRVKTKKTTTYFVLLTTKTSTTWLVFRTLPALTTSWNCCIGRKVISCASAFKSSFKWHGLSLINFYIQNSDSVPPSHTAKRE
jgi:hypothetical protein